ncbi:uncharacterized protein EI90DRAFT_3144149 [Cantharellus anzutake]|uniref:uncharacterized protein n=1 Tax=Cantharellus anzutake TaxID=1750568 RepID=UPI001906F5F7|nr:uncharacterized protein EI90DRAFT_3147752 [Cantharellus anzutake]XP_038920587.1 uncharacterized protein EI90DRAFT_3144149 [Cantharellus anzutake]KAF8313156.1 hypothetical protein EI90DRAFT_3147752 [Cantharellus anzutake]KAF8338714.1 hypothetical protein EI90DRAFT_3144149 [Cantharellus anzutake]
MSESDTIALFAEGTFEEQVQDLVNYIVRGLSDESRTTAIKPFQELFITRSGRTPLNKDAERKKKVISMVIAETKTLGQGSEREIEGFFNLLISHVLTLFTDTSSAKGQIEPLIAVITSSASESSVIKYRILSNIFNALPRQSPIRLQVYNALFSLATSNKELDTIQVNKSTVDRWLSEWDVSPDEKGTFLKSLAIAFEQAGDATTSYSYLFSRLEVLPDGSSEAEQAAIDVIIAALRLPTVFDLNKLLKTSRLEIVKDRPLFALLRIIAQGDLKDYKQWESGNQQVLSKSGLDAAAVEKKIRFLTLATLASDYVGKEISYSKIASTIQVPESDVELWVINAVRSNLLAGKLSQLTQTFCVTRSITRAFQKPDWKLLEEKLSSWRTNLIGVLEVVESARKSAQPAPTGPPVHGDLAKEAPAST